MTASSTLLQAPIAPLPRHVMSLSYCPCFILFGMSLSSLSLYKNRVSVPRFRTHISLLILIQLNCYSLPVMLRRTRVDLLNASRGRHLVLIISLRHCRFERFFLFRFLLDAMCSAADVQCTHLVHFGWLLIVTFLFLFI